MRKQTGISTAGIALVVVVLAAGGGGYFAWQQHQELARDLASTKSALNQASADARAAKTDAATARREIEEQKVALQQARIDRDAAQAFLETEKGHSVRLQSELSLAREQIAFLRDRGPASRMQPSVIQPSVVQTRPARIEAIQVQRPQGASPIQAAPAPGQGYGRPQ